MKRVFLAVMIVVMLAGYAHAADALAGKVPTVRTGIAYSLKGDCQKTFSLTTADLITYKEKVVLGAGLATDLEGNNLQVATVSYKVGGVKDLGFTFPFADMVNLEVGAYVGRDLINTGDGKARNDFGVQATAINWTW